MTTSTICILDDDPEIRVFLSEYLAEYEYHLVVCSTGDELTTTIASLTVDLVIIDLMLGRENGLTIASQLRQRHDFPIIMISANKEDTEKVIGLEMAVDDFMEKPINPRLLLAKIRALLRRHNKIPDPVETVLNIMDAASDAVKWVHSNWELSEQELNSHCEAIAAGNCYFSEKTVFANNMLLLC